MRQGADASVTCRVFMLAEMCRTTSRSYTCRGRMCGVVNRRAAHFCRCIIRTKRLQGRMNVSEMDRTSSCPTSRKRTPETCRSRDRIVGTHILLPIEHRTTIAYTVHDVEAPACVDEVDARCSHWLARPIISFWPESDRASTEVKPRQFRSHFRV